MRRNSTNPEVWVLLSGGIDSTACMAFYLSQDFPVRAAFVDYGQVAANREANAAKDVAKYYQVPLERFKCLGFHKKKAGLICGRNAFLLVTALMEISDNVGILAIGVHAGTNYLDCGPLFIRKMQTIFDMYTGGRVQIGTPFLKWTKREIWMYCKSQAVPLKLTYSCERGVNQPCGRCLSCRDLKDLYAYT